MMILTGCSFVLKFRSEFEQGDKVIVHNIKKANKLPGTKDTKIYLRPCTIEEVKLSHLVACKDPHSKTATLPIHMYQNITHVNH